MNPVLGSHYNKSAQITIVVDGPSTSSPDYFGLFSGWEWEGFLRGKFLRAGISLENCSFIDLSKTPIEDIRDLDTSIFLSMGEKSLNTLTNRFSIDKWQLSPLDTLPEFKCRKVIPTFSLRRIKAQYELGMYLELAIQRTAKESQTLLYTRTEERFHINPSFDETMAMLDFVKDQPVLSVDVETGYGQINTVGFAWSESDAIAINTLPTSHGEDRFYELWSKIAEILEGPAKKVYQNYIYDTMYFSSYGIRTNNIYFDTMWAMKFLWPEFDMNLGNVGRLYTNRPYWKDDGKSEDGEGKKKDWGNIRDWHRHYLYNCRDTTGTFEAHLAQRKDMEERNLLGLFDGYMCRLIEPIYEMCSNGMPLSLERREEVKTKTKEKIDELTKKLAEEVGREVNPRSPKQVMELLREHKVTIPKKFDKEKETYKESANASSIKKIRLKHPELKFLGTLADIKSYDTALSRYVDFHVKPNDDRIRFSLRGTGTETLRFAGGKDGWGCGFNIQTIPQEGGDVSIKQMMQAPKGYSFVEVDLRQAESRFVAYDSADKTLIDMLESGADVHSYVANEIVKQMGKDVNSMSKEEFKGTWRQLGKKSGHGFNYDMRENIFVETVFMEMDLVLAKKDATTIRQTYFDLFPGIPRWHQGIKKELYNKRKLVAPSGWERYFYGRYGDDLFKEAYAWKPQHTIPWLTNNLMLHLCDERKAGNVEFNLIVQVHDSLINLVPDDGIAPFAKICLDTKAGHPIVDLPGGRMWIPREVKFGKCLNDMKEWGI